MSDLPRPLFRTALGPSCAATDSVTPRARSIEMARDLAQVARCYRAVGAIGPAESGLALALRWARLTGCTELCTDLLAELAETATILADALAGQSPAAARAARDRARDHVFEAATLVPALDEPCNQPQTLLRLSDVLERCGDHDDACALHRQALRLLGGQADGDDPALLPSLGRLAGD